MWEFLTLYYFRRRRLASDERIHASPSDSAPTMNRGRERQRDRRERKKGKVSVEADAVVSDGRWRGSAVAAAAIPPTNLGFLCTPTTSLVLIH